MLRLFGRMLIGFLVTCVIALGGLFAMVIAKLSGAGDFYVALAVIVAVAIWLLIIAQIWQLLKPKIRYISLAALVGVIFALVAGVEINRAYHNSFDIVNEQGVNLSLYEPFREDTKAASLSEPSTLQIDDNPPKIDGATALYPLYSAFAKAVYPEQDNYVTSKKEMGYIDCSNTDGAYKRLIIGDADIIFVAGPSKEQLQMAEDAKVELTFTPVGREAFVFFVNAKNHVNNLSTGDIQKIYSGEARNWKYFDGGNTGIRAFQRPTNSGSQTALINFMGEIPLMIPPQEDVVSAMGGMVQVVSSYRNYDNAIGYSFLFFATEMVNDNKIKLLSVDGIAPTRENVTNGTYPYSAEFFAVTAGTTNSHVESFIEWILSEQGQYLVEKTGYTPIHSHNI